MHILANIWLFLFLTLNLTTKVLAGQFMLTCKWTSLNWPKFTAGCRPNWGEIFSYPYTSINLSRCLMNNDGNLGWLPNGGAGPSCGSCRIVNGRSLIGCSCRRRDGLWHYTEIELDHHMKNNGGQLMCDWEN